MSADKQPKEEVNAGKPPPKEVRVRAYFHRIIEVHMLEQTFTADLQIEASWVDKGMQQTLAGVQLDTVDFAKDHRVWNPYLSFRNLISDDGCEVWYTVYQSKDGAEPVNVVDCESDLLPVVCRRWRCTRAVFQNSMKLHQFPFDIQRLPISLTVGYDVADVVLVGNVNPAYRSFVVKHNFAQSGEYELVPRVFLAQAVTLRQDSCSGRVYPVLNVSVVVRRWPSYFLWNVGLPILVISLLSFSAFAIPAADIADRLGVSLTLLLTIMAFKYVITDRLPNFNNLTYVDHYMLICTAFVILVCVTNLLASRLAKTDSDAADAVDFVGGATLGGLFLVTQALFVRLWWKPPLVDAELAQQFEHYRSPTAEAERYNRMPHLFFRVRFPVPTREQAEECAAAGCGGWQRLMQLKEYASPAAGKAEHPTVVMVLKAPNANGHLPSHADAAVGARLLQWVATLRVAAQKQTTTAVESGFENLAVQHKMTAMGYVVVERNRRFAWVHQDALY
jgi:hypothetical protein